MKKSTRETILLALVFYERQAKWLRLVGYSLIENLARSFICQLAMEVVFSVF